MTRRLLEVLTAADTRRIVEVATLRARLGAAASADNELGAIIDELTAGFEAFILRPFALQRYRETVTGDGRELLILRRAPIELGSVTVTIDGTARTDWEWYSAEEGILYLAGGWPCEAEIVVTLYAGWLLPGLVSTWAATTTYALGAWVRPTRASLSSLLFQASVAGAGGATEPTWPTTAGQTVVSGGVGGVTFTGRAVSELPASITNLAIVAARAIWEGREGVSWRQIEGVSQRFDDTGPSGLPLFVERGLSRYVLHGA